jgi:hypothetical protein
MLKTIDVIAHGGERLEDGGFIAKRDVLPEFGSTPTLYDGRIELMPFERLIPTEEGLLELKAEIEKVQPQVLRIGNLELEPIRANWLGRQGSNLRITGPKPVALPLGYAPLY